MSPQKTAGGVKTKQGIGDKSCQIRGQCREHEENHRLAAQAHQVAARVIYITISALIIVMLLLAVYVFLDFRAKTTGMIIGGGSSVFAWVLIAVLLAGSAVTIAAMITVVRISKE